MIHKRAITLDLWRWRSHDCNATAHRTQIPSTKNCGYCWNVVSNSFFKKCDLLSFPECMRVIQKVSSDGLLRKKKQEYITNHVYCHLMYTLYTTFRHSFHHCWGTCHSVAPVFVPLHRRNDAAWDAKHVVTASLTSSSWNHRPATKDLRCRNKWQSPGAKSGL